MIETSCPNNDISRLVVLGIGIGEKMMTRRTGATSDCHIDLEVYSKCASMAPAEWKVASTKLTSHATSEPREFSLTLERRQECEA